MSRLVTALILFFILPSLAWTQEEAQSQQRTHEVVRGETLWTLAQRFYGNPYRWPLIYEANADRIADPNLVEPGQILVIPGLGAEPQSRDTAVQPQDSTARFQGVTVVTRDVTDPVDVADPVPAQVSTRVEGAGAMAGRSASEPCPGPGERTLFYQGTGGQRTCASGIPGGGQRTQFYPHAGAEQSLEVSVPRMGAAGPGAAMNVASTAAVPIGIVYQAEWLDSSRDESYALGTLSGFSRLMAVRTPEGPVRMGERVLLTVEEGVTLQVGDVLQSFRPHREERGYGVVQRPSGILVVTQVGESFIVATVSSEFDRIFVGDRIRRAPAYTLNPGDFPQPVESDLTGVVLWFPDERGFQGIGANLFLDLGLEDGLEIGDLFRAYVDDPGPGYGLEAAQIQIVLVEQGRATGRIVSMKHPGVEMGDTLRLIAKMY